MITRDIQFAAQLLRQGELVAIPTETVYGLAANGFDGTAVARIFEAKNRPSFNPLILHSNSLERFTEWGIFLPEKALKLADRFSPGPLTYVVQKSALIPDIVTAGHSSVAIRIPNHPVALELLKSLTFPLAAPSANPSGMVSPTTAFHVEEQLGPKIGAVLDGGPCSVGLESTIVSFTGPEPELLRIGGLAIEEIEMILGTSLNKARLINNENPLAPGMLSKHYSPATKLRIGKPEDFTGECSLGEMAWISFKTIHPRIPMHQQLILSPEGHFAEAAKNLFDYLRIADKLNVKLIVAELMPEENLGRAINDRLKRAAVN